MVRELSRSLIATALVLQSVFLSTLSSADVAKLRLEPIADGLVAPIDIASLPAPAGAKLILDQSGLIHLLGGDGKIATKPFLDIRDRLRDLEQGFEERGLLGMAIHPDYVNNGRVFVTYTAKLSNEAPRGWNYTRIVSEFTPSADDATALNPDTERVILSQHWPSRKHNGGALAFGPDNYLYVGFGDGGGIHGVGEEVLFDAFSVPQSHMMWDNFAQDLQTLYGKILRIDIDQGYPGYAIPGDNPFVGKPGRDEIYAFGFRNPYRISFDPNNSGDFFVTAVAETLWESIYRVDQPGNYGWPLREASHCFNRQTPLTPPPDCEGIQSATPDFPISYPVVEYPNMSVQREGVKIVTNGDGIGIANGVGTAVVGAIMYRGNAIASMQDHLVFADWSLDFQKPSGQLFVATPAHNALWSFEKLTQFDTRIVALIQDQQDLFVLTNENFGPYGNTGKVFRLTTSDP